MHKIFIILFICLFPFVVFAESNKKERNYIKEGNKMFSEKRYGDAEKSYRKALEANESSDIARFNLATTFVRQTNVNDTTKNSLIQEAIKMYENVGKSTDKELAARALYDIGNIYYNRKDFAKSIDYYKQSLRANPNDDQARQNLRLAQKQLQNQQQNQQQNQNDNKQDQNKQENKKEQQNQNKEKNKNGKDQNKQDQQPPRQEDKNSMSKENAEQILQTMQNEEKNTQDKVNKAKMQQMKGSRRTTKQW